MMSQEPVTSAKQVGVIEVQTSRFGIVQVEETAPIRFPAGVIGFPDETEFVLVPHGDSDFIAWLQSAKTPELAFPVVSAHGLVADYPDVDIEKVADRVGLGAAPEDLALLLVLSTPRGLPATVNLLAPVVVNSRDRVGAQLFLEGSRFSTRELFVTPREAAVESDGEPSGEPGMIHA